MSPKPIQLVKTSSVFPISLFLFQLFWGSLSSLIASSGEQVVQSSSDYKDRGGKRFGRVDIGMKDEGILRETYPRWR